MLRMTALTKQSNREFLFGFTIREKDGAKYEKVYNEITEILHKRYQGRLINEFLFQLIVTQSDMLEASRLLADLRERHEKLDVEMFHVQIHASTLKGF